MKHSFLRRKNNQYASEDPVIAIRALRLRSSLEQVTQYLNKNIPDADSWLKTTEGAVDEAVSVITDLYAYCEQGATDSYSPSERSTLAESLNKLRGAYYAEGDVEYAGRYLFSGYMTDTPLTYQSDETAAKADFTITQEFTRENIELKTVYTNAYSNDDILNLNVKTDAATGNVITPNVADVHRVRIGYTKVSDAGTFEIKLNDGTTLRQQLLMIPIISREMMRQHLMQRQVRFFLEKMYISSYMLLTDFHLHTEKITLQKVI